MGSNLSIRPRRHRDGRLWFLSAIILIIVVLVWQRGWAEKIVLTNLAQNIRPYTSPVIANIIPAQPQTPSQTTSPSTGTAPLPPSSVQAETVTLVEAQIVENPKSEAHTADLHVDTGEADSIPWPNVAGRTKVQLYTVQSGDSLWGIADQFELDLDTLRWSNPELERNPDVLAVDTELVILPVPGVYHYVTGGDTVESIAALYGVAPSDITDFPPNALYPPYDLEAGSGLIVPFGQKGVILPRPVPATETQLGWPVVSVVSGGYAFDHPAFDIAAPYGSMVYAAGQGEVIFAGWAEDGFGYTVIIDHGDNLQTWYTHLKGTLLQSGAIVAQGTPIGEVGSTGHSTGPHVHFEVRLNEARVNPANYLSAVPQ